MMTTPQTPPPAPTALVEGAFALFRRGDGLVLVWRRKGETQDHPMVIPPHIIAMGAQMSGMSLDQVITKITQGDFPA